MEKIDPNVSLDAFAPQYLQSLKQNLSDFGLIFRIVMGFQIAATIIALFATIPFIFRFGFLAALNGVITIAFIVLMTWFTKLCKTFVNLQLSKTENELQNTITFRNVTKNTSDKILEAAEKRAGHNISVNGDNTVLALDGGSVSGVSQNKTVTGSSEILQTLSLLIEYCKESGNTEAAKYAQELAAEATKPNKDKSILFDIWNKIISLEPSISKISKIVLGVKSVIF